MAVDWNALAARFDKLSEVHLIQDPAFVGRFSVHAGAIPTVASRSREEVELARALADFCRAMA